MERTRSGLVAEQSDHLVRIFVLGFRSNIFISFKQSSKSVVRKMIPL